MLTSTVALLVVALLAAHATASVAVATRAPSPPSPDQTQMELFVAPFNVSCPDSLEYDFAGPVCLWNGVGCHPFSGRVLSIDWDGICGSGSSTILDFTLVPSAVTSVVITDSQLAGVVQLAPGSTLEKLVVRENGITGIDLTALPSTIEWLDVSNNAIGSLGDLRKLPSGVFKLHLDGNAFTGPLDLSALSPTLRSFSANSNNFTSLIVPARLSTEAFSASLDLSNNQMTSITGPANAIPSASVLLGNNQFTTFDAITWSVFAKPSFMDLSYNSVTDLIGTDLPNSLQTLVLGSNPLTTVDLSFPLPQQLSAIAADSDNVLSDTYDFSSFSGLESVVFTPQNLPVDNISVVLSGLTKLETFDLESFPANVQKLFLDRCLLVSFRFGPVRPMLLTTLDLSQNILTTLDWAAVPRGMQVLKLRHNKLGSFTFLAPLLSLIVLALRGNQLTTFDWQGMAAKAPALEQLDLNGNLITTADFSKLPTGLMAFPSLGQLSMNGNTLTSLVFGQIPAGLQYVDLAHHRLAQVVFGGGNKHVHTLLLNDNFITSQYLHVSQLPQGLLTLDVSRNNLTSLHMARLSPTLSTVIASDNLIAFVSFSGELTLLHVGNNQLQTFALQAIPSTLALLNLSANLLTTITGPVPSSSGLQTLLMRHNRINMAMATLVGFLPASLTVLDVLGNQLSGHFSFAALPAQLLTLVAADNDLTGPLDFTKGYPKYLQSVFVSKNRLSSIAALPTMAPASRTNEYTFLVAARNQITGTLPLGVVSYFNYIDLNSNALSGTIDLNVTKFIYYQGQNFDFSGNAQITGTPVCPELPAPQSDPYLNYLNLNDTSICGSFNCNVNRIIVPSRCFSALSSTVVCPPC